jgi:hypothetical protein
MPVVMKGVNAEHALELAAAATDLLRRQLLGRRRVRERRAVVERAVRSVLVVVADVGADDLFELAPAEDQDPVEAFAAQASHPALGMRLRLWRSHRRLDHTDAIGTEHFVEAARELAVAVTHEEPHRPLLLGEGQYKVACLLRHPALVRIRGHAAEMDAAVRELDEKEHVQAPQPDGVDGQEVAGDDRDACARRNSDQLSSARRGAGSIPCRRRIAQIVLGASARPSPTSSPWTRR